MKPYLQDADLTLYLGDALEVLRELPDESVDCCVTSPPYWGLRDYGTGEWEGGDPDCEHRQQLGGEGKASAKQNTSVGTQALAYRDTCGKCGATRVDRQLGLEETPDLYLSRMVEVFREVRRVLAKHGTCWVNMGSSYFSDPAKGGSGTFNGRNGRGEDYARGKRASQSRQPQRDPSCGSDGREPHDSSALDSACLDLCDECLDDFRNHHGRSASTSQPPSLTPLPDEMRARDSEPLDSSQATGDAEPPDAPASTTLGSSPRPLALCCHCGTRPASVSLRVLPIGALDARECARNSACSDGTTQPSPPSAGRIEGKEPSDSARGHYTSTLKAKDLVMMPAMLAMALQEDGWYLRSEIVWAKPNPMPESVTDRPTKAHEMIYLLSRSPRYFFDLEPVTHRENILRGMCNAAINARKTHCISGHPFNAENTGRTKKGGRYCKPCARAAARRAYYAGREITMDFYLQTDPESVAEHMAALMEEGAR